MNINLSLFWHAPLHITEVLEKMRAPRLLLRKALEIGDKPLELMIMIPIAVQVHSHLPLWANVGLPQLLCPTHPADVPLHHGNDSVDGCTRGYVTTFLYDYKG
jgi:hypothetical protein